MVDFGMRLRTLRLQKGLTQIQVADRVGVSKAMISSYELSVRQPSYDILIKLAALFGVSTDFLLGMNSPRTIEVSGLSERDVALLCTLRERLKEK